MSYTAILAADKNIIPYRKELNAITGGVTSSILLHQISYWWVKSGSQPFYKFIQPCKHEKYHDGDSWIEELGFSRKEFLTAIKKLEDSGLVKKRTNANRLTYYSLDEVKLNQMLEGIYLNAERGFSKMPKGDLPLYTETTAETTTTTPIVPASGDDTGGKKQSEKEKAQTVLDLFNEVCGHVLPKSIALNAKRQRQIQAVCKLKLANGSSPFADYNKDAWRAYFHMILENPWNIGENPSGWVATIDYATRPDTVIKTLEKKYA